MATTTKARRYLLDTNVVSDLVRNPQGASAKRLVEVGDEAVCTSVIVSAELRYGAQKRQSKKLTAQLEAVLGQIEILALELEVDHHYAVIRAELESRGQPIGGNDLLIAAHCLSQGLVLVTDNEREFSRVPGLVVQNWIRDATQPAD